MGPRKTRVVFQHSFPSSIDCSIVLLSQVKPKKKTKASDASSTKQQTLKDEMALCHVLLDALEENEDCWPFLEPVEKKAFPEYFKVIKKPMDLQTVRNKLEEKK